MSRNDDEDPVGGCIGCVVVMVCLTIIAVVAGWCCKAILWAWS